MRYNVHYIYVYVSSIIFHIHCVPPATRLPNYPTTRYPRGSSVTTLVQGLCPLDWIGLITGKPVCRKQKHIHAHIYIIDTYFRYVSIGRLSLCMYSMAEYNDTMNESITHKKHKKSNKKHKKHRNTYDEEHAGVSLINTNNIPATTTQLKSESIVSTCLYTTAVTIHIHLYPNQLNNIHHSVVQHINTQYIMQYNNDIDGTILSYSDIQYNSNTGTILYDRPHINFSLNCTILLYKPVVGCIIHGTVNKITNDYISCLMYNTFNITINYNSIPPAYKYNHTTNQWIYNNQYIIQLDAVLQLHIVDIVIVNNMVALETSLRYPGTGIVVDNNVIQLSNQQLHEISNELYVPQHTAVTQSHHNNTESESGYTHDITDSANVQSSHGSYDGNTVHQSTNPYTTIQSNQLINNIQTQHTKHILGDNKQPLTKKQKLKHEKLLAKEQRRQNYLNQLKYNQ